MILALKNAVTAVLFQKQASSLIAIMILQRGFLIPATASDITDISLDTAFRSFSYVVFSMSSGH